MIISGKLNDTAKTTGAYGLAMLLFAPLSLAIQMSDGGMDSELLKKHLSEITKNFEERYICIQK